MSSHSPKPVEFEKLFISDADSARALGGTKFEREVFAPLQALARTLVRIDRGQEVPQ
jgi:hypothetical protein